MSRAYFTLESETFLSDTKTVGVVGDFNNSVVWDKPKSNYPFREQLRNLRLLDSTVPTIKKC